MYITIDSLIETNNITTGYNITLRIVNVSLMDLIKYIWEKELLEDKLYQIID